MIQEIWKDIIGWEGFYQVSDQGGVRSMDRTISAVNPHGRISNRTYKGRVLRASPVKGGYLIVSLTAPGRKREYRYVHHLVMRAFVGSRPEWCQEIRHLDGVKLNCALGNLTYGTYAENAEDRVKHGQVTSGNRKRKLTDDQIAEARSWRGVVSNRAIARKFGVSHSVMNGYMK